MIHPSSFIDSSAKIADDVSIGPFCYIGKNVTLESGCIIASHVNLNDNVTCKANTKIFSYVNIGNHNSCIVIGENTHIREFSIIGTDEENNKDVNIAHDNFIMAYVRIDNGVNLDASCVITNAVTIEKNVTCKEKVIIGGLSTIVADKTIGSGAMIGGASYIDKDMPPFTLVEGNRAEVRGLNIVGLRRRLKNRNDIEEIKSAYKAIFRNGLDKEEAKQRSENTKNPYVKQFCDFITAKDV